MAYLYRHIRLDKNEPFYIGIGSDEKYKRAYSKKSRNKYWSNIANITEYEVEIMLDNLTWEEVCKKEIEFVRHQQFMTHSVTCKENPNFRKRYDKMIKTVFFYFYYICY